MEDAQIIDHFFRRDPEAIRAAQEKYEKRCLAAARHILPDDRDAEECVSDVWLRLWNAIPPERPRSLAAYITTVTRRLALDKCDYNRAAQRRSDLTVAFEELEPYLATCTTALLVLTACLRSIGRSTTKVKAASA